MLGLIVQQFARAGAAGERIFEILDAESAVRRSPTPSVLENVRGDVRFDHVSFGYDAISPVLANVDFDAPAGQDRRAAGPDRQRQDDGRQPAAALLRRDRRRHHDRRHRHPRRHAGLAAGEHRHHPAGRLPVLRDDPRQHRLRRRRARPTSRSSRPRRSPASTTSSCRCPTATTPGSASAASRSRAARSSASRSRAPCCSTPRSSSSTTRPRASTPRPSTSSSRRSSAVMKGRTTLVIAQRLRTVKNADQILVMKDGYHRGARHARGAHRPRRPLPRDLRPRAARPGRRR